MPSTMPHAGGGGMMVLGAGAVTGAASGNMTVVMVAVVFLALWTVAMAGIAAYRILPKSER